MTPPARTNSGKRFSLYGFAFLREGGGAELSPAARYGGGQAALIARYRLSDGSFEPTLQLRSSRAFAEPRQEEVATGVQLRPVRKLPLYMAIERRFRSGGPDSVSAYLYGGVDSIALPAGFDLSAYGQAGIDRADQGADRLRYFFDASVRADRPAAKLGKIQLRAGGGLWAGGQSGARRVDIGPTASADLAIGDINLRLSSDYRFRLTGDAAPGSGPAVTLSVSY